MRQPYSAGTAQWTLVERPPRPRCSSRTRGLLVVEHRAGGLGKRTAYVSSSRTVCAWLSLIHLRFATPARPALHDLRQGVLGRCLSPSFEPRRRSSGTARAGVANLRCLKPRRLPQVHVPPNLLERLLSPPEQCPMIAGLASSRPTRVRAHRRTRWKEMQPREQST